MEAKEVWEMERGKGEQIYKFRALLSVSQLPEMVL